jgi:hypothetical protein
MELRSWLHPRLKVCDLDDEELESSHTTERLVWRWTCWRDRREKIGTQRCLCSHRSLRILTDFGPVELIVGSGDIRCSPFLSVLLVGKINEEALA